MSCGAGTERPAAAVSGPRPGRRAVPNSPVASSRTPNATTARTNTMIQLAEASVLRGFITAGGGGEVVFNQGLRPEKAGRRGYGVACSEREGRIPPAAVSAAGRI